MLKKMKNFKKSIDFYSKSGIIDNVREMLKMKKRKVVLKSWVENLLSMVLVTYVLFITCTIESIGNNAYNLILLVFTIISVISFYLLKRFSNVLSD